MADQGGSPRRSGASRKIKVAMELRPALEGFAGIPQETRLEFSAFAHSDLIDPVGVLNPHARRSTPGIPLKSSTPFASRHKQYARLSRHIISYDESPILSRFDRIKFAIEDRIHHHSTGLGALLGFAEEVRRFIPDGFDNFLWTRFFAKSLPVSDFGAVTNREFWTLRTAWSAAQRAGLVWNAFPSFRFGDADFFMSQTPWPGKVLGRTQAIVRYHDAIPMFYPQYIPEKVIHQFSHYQGLVKNMRRKAKFACVSRAVADDLLKMFPQAEGQVEVIHNVVSHQYYLAEAPAAEVSDIIRTRLDKDTCPQFLTVRERDTFYTKHTNPSDLRFLLAVSTIEPRKNHSRLIAAWEMLRRTVCPNLKLVFVGSLGWDCDQIIDAMKAHLHRGSFFHLSKVPAPDLRMLYRFADAVVCPSYAEGFDLSGVEAMLSGGVVVASDIPVHREVYEHCATYFDPFSTMACFNRLKEALDPDNKKPREMRIEGQRYAKRFSRDAILPKWEAYFESLIVQRSREFV